ncbi:hypothetical protein GCM10009775_13920 [Microbacterium aoyamense]|uniref:DUF998 domain-containing protein n=1 Tax=Microbacterium aoyamense TaxID=344166 RepID=A0ABP5AUB8_9MICO|nr:DUF998 domain-containing protein [Microbacterium aoyamense]
MISPSAPASRRESRLLAAASGDADVAGERSLETLALGVGAASFVLSAVIALFVFGFQDAPISGPGSVGQYAAIASAVVAILAFVAGRLLIGAGGRFHWLDIVDIAALAFAHAIIALLTWTLLAVILEQGFIGAEVFALPVLILSGAVAAVTGYVVFYSATHMDLQLLAVVLAVFLTEGVIASMLTASDPNWWKDNLSALGMTNDLSAMTFNLTLIVAGIIVTTLARYTVRGIPTPNPHGLARVRTCLILVGIFLGLVGVFPVDQFFAIHTGVASGMAVVYGILVFRLHAWIPDLPRAFLVLGWVFTAVIVVLAVFFAVGYYTLTAVELVAGILIFAWIILFIRNAAALQQDTGGAV